MNFSFFKKETPPPKENEDQHFSSDKTFKLTKDDVLKIREELARYENHETKKKEQQISHSRQEKKQEKTKERNRFLNVAIIVLVLLLGVVAYAVLNW